MKKSDLLTALEIVKPGLANKEVIEQSTSFAFMEDRVVTYNDEISLSHPVEGLEITGAIQATELYLILKKIKQDEIEVELTDTEVLLTAGKTKVGLTLQTEIKLPLEEIGTKEKWKTLPEDFLEALKMAMYCCSTDNSKPVLTCVNVSEEGFIEGSDSFRAIRTQLSKAVAIPTFLIPATSVNILLKLNPTKIASGTGWVHFKTKIGTVMSCRILEDSFPDLTKLLKVKGSEITFPKTISEILERASVFKVSDGSSNVELVSITLENNRIKIKSNSDTGWFSEDAKTVYDGDKLEFSIVPSLLKNILLTVKTCVFNGSMLKFEGETWKFITVVNVKS